MSRIREGQSTHRAGAADMGSEHCNGWLARSPHTALTSGTTALSAQPPSCSCRTRNPGGTQRNTTHSTQVLHAAWQGTPAPTCSWGAARSDQPGLPPQGPDTKGKVCARALTCPALPRPLPRPLPRLPRRHCFLRATVLHDALFCLRCGCSGPSVKTTVPNGVRKTTRGGAHFNTVTRTTEGHAGRNAS